MTKDEIIQRRHELLAQRRELHRQLEYLRVEFEHLYIECDHEGERHYTEIDGSPGSTCPTCGRVR